MKPIDVKLIQVKNCLVCKTNRVPKGKVTLKRDRFTVVVGDEVYCTLFWLSEDRIDFGCDGKGYDCKFYDTEAEAKSAYDAYTAMIDEYNREHEEPEKIGEPKYDEKTGQWYQRMGMELLNDSEACDRCCFDRACGEVYPCYSPDVKCCVYCVAVDAPAKVEAEEPEWTALPKHILEDAQNWECPACGSIACPGEPWWRWVGGWQHLHITEWVATKRRQDPKIRIFEVYTHAESRLKKFFLFDEGSFPVCEARGMEGFAGYEVRYPDGTKHTVATPFVFVNDEGDWSIESDDEYRHKSTLTGVVFLEDE